MYRKSFDTFNIKLKIMNLKLTINSLFMAIALLVSAGCTTENGDDNESSHVANQQVSLSFYQVTMQSLRILRQRLEQTKAVRVLL